MRILRNYTMLSLIWLTNDEVKKNSIKQKMKFKSLNETRLEHKQKQH